MAEGLTVSLTDDILDVLVQTPGWKQNFAHCVAIPSPSGGCSSCGRSRRVSLTDGDRNRVKDCLLNADPARISSLKASLHAAKLIVFTRAAGGTLQRHDI